MRTLFLTLLSILSIESQAQNENPSEYSIKLIIEKNITEIGVDPIEGIWVGTNKLTANLMSLETGVKELWDPNSKTSPVTLAIVRNGSQYKVYQIIRSPSKLQNGDIQISNVNGQFKAKLNDFSGHAVFREQGALTISMMMPQGKAKERLLSQEYRDFLSKHVKSPISLMCFSEMMLTKSYPLEGDINFIKAKIIRQSPRSGTGFALTADGYIATNYHVVEDAITIMVRGVNGNFDIGLRAEVIKSDQSADVAILKIADSDFLTLGRVPYPVSVTNQKLVRMCLHLDIR